MDASALGRVLSLLYSSYALVIIAQLIRRQKTAPLLAICMEKMALGIVPCSKTQRPSDLTSLLAKLSAA